MTLLFIKNYLILLLSVGLGSLGVFIVGFYWILKTFSPNKLLESEKNDISAIAGDDFITTQLDLAKAYIETGRHHLARKILEHVVEQGSDTQRKEAQTLLGYI